MNKEKELIEEIEKRIRINKSLVKEMKKPKYLIIGIEKLKAELKGYQKALAEKGLIRVEDVEKVIEVELNKWYRIIGKRVSNKIIASSNQNMIQLFVRELKQQLKKLGEK